LPQRGTLVAPRAGWKSVYEKEDAQRKKLKMELSVGVTGKKGRRVSRGLSEPSKGGP